MSSSTTKWFPKKPLKTTEEWLEDYFHNSKITECWVLSPESIFESQTARSVLFLEQKIQSKIKELHYDTVKVGVTKDFKDIVLYNEAIGSGLSRIMNNIKTKSKSNDKDKLIDVVKSNSEKYKLLQLVKEFTFTSIHNSNNSSNNNNTETFCKSRSGCSSCSYFDGKMSSLSDPYSEIYGKCNYDGDTIDSMEQYINGCECHVPIWSGIEG